MALSAVRWRFTFGPNGASGKVARQRFAYNFASTVVKGAAIQYANGTMAASFNTVANQIKLDVQAEIVHQAYLFRRLIVGAPPNISKPSGTLTSNDSTVSESLGDGLPNWAPRGAKYLRRKFQHAGTMVWFDNRDWGKGGEATDRNRALRRRAWTPKNAGYLFQASRNVDWQRMFGPVEVTITKNHELDQADAAYGIAVQPNGHVEVQVANIAVRALEKITPEMLPGLRGGGSVASNVGNEPLMGLVAETDDLMAERLRSRTGKYRPTLEPFLTFLLTKAIPAGVAKRLNEGKLGRFSPTAVANLLADTQNAIQNRY